MFNMHELFYAVIIKKYDEYNLLPQEKVFLLAYNEAKN